MSSSSDRFSLSNSGSERSRDSRSSLDDSSDREEVGSVGRIPVERVVEIREDPPEKLAESNWPAKTEYEWVAADVRTQRSLFRWSRLPKSWLNCTPIFEKGARRDIIAPERVTAVECACHGQEGATEEFFYIWAYLQAFKLLYMALYLEPSPPAFLYFFVTRPKSPITWLSLISRPGLNKLEAFTQSFKHFKDGFFKVVVKLAGRSHFYTADGNTKFPFFWAGNPWRYKVISREDLSVGEKEVVDTLMQFSDKMSTKGLVRVYNSVHPIIDIEGHMTQLGKKNLTLFQALRKEKAVKAKAVGNTVVPNLQDSLVDVHVHGGTKRKAELPLRVGKGKDVKKVRAAVMGAGSASGVKGPEAGLIELLETTVRKDIEINVLESLINSIDNMEPRALVKAMVELATRPCCLVGVWVHCMSER
ncbi:hypothetical protein DEO72_LG3g1164 [Vigna unguiculata]|uniref:Transposase n=1 Tax=Vigna unguiculata TaxID=3917 RepID=A0A4D6LDU2_VIGUN|nr:hypothetical protein DEO72_LG3g1164 [Vigna unguiculata]